MGEYGFEREGLLIKSLRLLNNKKRLGMRKDFLDLEYFCFQSPLSLFQLKIINNKTSHFKFVIIC